MDKETSVAECIKNTMASVGQQDETKKFVDCVNFRAMVPAGDHCSGIIFMVIIVTLKFHHKGPSYKI